MKTKQSITSFVLFPLLLILLASALFLSEMPHVSAIGCAPVGDLQSEGPYLSSIQGFVRLGSIEKENILYFVITVEPGSVFNMNFSYTNGHVPSTLMKLIPVITLDQPVQGSLPSWLNVSIKPNVAIILPGIGRANVTATFKVDKNAPFGEYWFRFEGVFTDTDEWDRTNCHYAQLFFLVRVSSEKKFTTTITSTITTTLPTTTTSTITTRLGEQVTDPSTYAWAVGATVIAAVFAMILLRKKTSQHSQKP